MDSQSEETLGWKQHFPTYFFKDRDVALEEYKFATKTLEAEERVFLNAANLTVIAGAAFGSLALGSLEKLTTTFSPAIPKFITLILVLIVTAGFAALVLRYFADRQKAMVYAARKVIVLRRMLGMTYGSLQLVLPNWRIEGADEPFAIRLFPGWNTYVAYPCFTIAGIASIVIFFVLSKTLNEIPVNGLLISFDLLILTIGLAASSFVLLSWLYRKALLDTHERVGILLAQEIAGVLNLRLVTNREYVIYRATLATHELNRLGIDLTFTKKILVYIEDRDFFTHSGVSSRGLGRLIGSLFGIVRRSGGSTITQQLVRTLFIQDQRKLVRRKIIELLLALSFDKVFAKHHQLDLYLASVRFETGVFGIAAALKYFFGTVDKPISKAQAFFLIERVSNTRSRLLVEKIDQTLRGALVSGLLSLADAREIVKLYRNAVHQRKIIDPEEIGISRLAQSWSA